MTKRHIFSFILLTVLSITFFGCDSVAELFHGEKPLETYTVTFDANGASGTPPAKHVVKSGTAVSLPDKGNLNSAGNIFVGWNENSEGGGITYSAGASIIVTQNMVFYAQWLMGSAPQYTVSFNANGATSGTAPVAQTVYSGTSITVPGHGTLANSGKTFGGWNTQVNGGGTNYEVGGFYTVTENVTLYAQWRNAAQYTVTYNSNGAGGAAPSAQTVDPGTEITIQGEGSMIYTGKKFSGWNTQANGGGTSYAEGALYTVNGNIILYAKWQDAEIITFNSVTANGSAFQTTTHLTLAFSQVIPGLNASDITISGVPGVTKGILSNSGSIYTLGISGFNEGGTLSVTVAKLGYEISGSPKIVTIYYAIPVTFNNITANGSDLQTTTQLTLAFSQAITGLSVDDISLSGISGVIKGTLSGSGPIYTLDISGFNTGGTLSVTVAKSGYDISGSPKTVTIYYAIPVTFNNVTANGSASQTTTQLTLTFSQAITSLSADDISLSGVSGVIKGTISGSGPAYTLGISGFNIGGSLSVSVAKSGYVINGSPKTVDIYKVVTVTFNSNGGSNNSGQTITSGAVASRPANPTRSSYIFDYWYQDSGLTIPYYFNTPVTADITLYAKWVSNTDITTMSGKNMVWVAGGTFTMGSPQTGAYSMEESPQHSVTLSGFYMGKYEVTQEQYKAVMGSIDSSNPSSAVPGESETPGKLPVVSVSWYDALVFCNKLSIKEGLSPSYSISGRTDPAAWGDVPTNNNETWNAVVIVTGSSGYRLPTEAQWEYACRAGTTTNYNTGDTISDNTGWYEENSNDKAHKVGLKTANAWGLYDMHGNVAEWCWDRTGFYFSDAQTNPMGASSGTRRVLRGGAFDDIESFLRSARRYIYTPYPYVRFGDIGFRLVRP
jgi:uncharacterized repeat protein (TIGR02543 family)